MTWEIQSNFSAGVLDDKLKGRIDLGIYFSGISVGENVIPLPQGGMTRRPGFQYIAEESSDRRLFAFEYSIEESYVITFSDTAWTAYTEAGVLVDNDTHTFGSDIFQADFVQSGSVLILVHPNHAPAALNRDAVNAFTFGDLNLLNIPQFNYDDVSSPVPISNIQTLTFTSVGTSDRYRLQLSDFLTAELAFSSDALENETRIQEALLDLAIIDSDSSTVTVVNSSISVYEITFSGNSADDYGELNGLIVEAVSVSAQVTAVVDQVGVSKREDVWSSTRGWPVSTIFHEGRLVFGGSRSKPATLWLSFVNDFFNFKEGSGRDDEAIVATLNTDQLNAIVGLSTNRNLQIFTSGQEFFVPVSPLTPANIVIKPQSRYGALAIKPQVIDGFTCYVQRTGKALRRFVLSEFESSYESISVSFLAPDLVANPVDMTVQAGVFNIDAPFLYLVNDDGTMSVYSSKKDENINTWVKWTTDGLFKSVVAVGDSVFAFVEREDAGGSPLYFLEKLFNEPDSQMWCDSGIRYDQAASPTIGGLGHLDGLSVRIVADGAVQDDQIVSGSTVTLDRDTEFGWVGLDYNPLIKTMPAVGAAPGGSNFPLRKRFVRIRPLLLDSSGVYISNGVDEIFLADRLFNVDTLDSPPNARSGIGQGVKFLGWSYDGQIIIKQYDPLPFTITSLSMELS